MSLSRKFRDLQATTAELLSFVAVKTRKLARAAKL